MDAWNAHDPAAVAERMTDDVVSVDPGVDECMDGRSAVRAMEAMFSSDYRSDFSRASSTAIHLQQRGRCRAPTMAPTLSTGSPPPVTGSRSPASRSAECGDGKIAENKGLLQPGRSPHAGRSHPSPQSASAAGT
jgi:hypothetical protein